MSNIELELAEPTHSYNVESYLDMFPDRLISKIASPWGFLMVCAIISGPSQQRQLRLRLSVTSSRVSACRVGLTPPLSITRVLLWGPCHVKFEFEFSQHRTPGFRRTLRSLHIGGTRAEYLNDCPLLTCVTPKRHIAATATGWSHDSVINNTER